MKTKSDFMLERLELLEQLQAGEVDHDKLFKYLKESGRVMDGMWDVMVALEEAQQPKEKDDSTAPFFSRGAWKIATDAMRSIFERCEEK